VTDLYDWLTNQHAGVKTYIALRDKALDLAASDPQHRALYRLLATLTDKHVSQNEEEAVPVDLAEQNYRELLNIVADAEASLTAGASEQIQALNRLAAAKLS
jgi:hypothetical protein